MHQFRQLEVWKRSIALADMTYDAIDDFPRREVFGLQSQMRRASVSIPSNIAEGAGTDGKRAFNRYLRIAYGSACELESQIVIAEKRSLLDPRTGDVLLSELDQIRRMLYALVSNPT